MIDIDVQKIAKMYSMQGVPLISIIGGERNGFYQQDAIKLVRFFLTEVIPIVGVDVYLLKKGILYLTEARDNWYCERLKNECLFLYTQRSCTSAIEFITNYIPKDAIPIFDIYPFDFSSITETDDGDRDHGIL